MGPHRGRPVGTYARDHWPDRGQALPLDKLGLVQLSNRIVVPPDGFTFAGAPDGALLGYAWMSLPLTPSYTNGSVPTGSRSWMLFLNASNFHGAVAYFTPEQWSALTAMDGSNASRCESRLFTCQVILVCGHPQKEMMWSVSRRRRPSR